MLFWEGCEAEQEKEGLEGLRCRECDSLKKRQFTAAIALTSLITFFLGLWFPLPLMLIRVFALVVSYFKTM